MSCVLCERDSLVLDALKDCTVCSREIMLKISLWLLDSWDKPIVIRQAEWLAKKQTNERRGLTAAKDVLS